MATTENPNGSWISQHKGIVAGGAIVVVIGAYFLYKKMHSTTPSSTTPTATQRVAPEIIAPTGTGASGYYTNQAAYQNLAKQFSTTINALKTSWATYINQQAAITSTLKAQDTNLAAQLAAQQATTGGSSSKYSNGGTGYVGYTQLKMQGTGYSISTFKGGSEKAVTGSSWSTISSYTATLSDIAKGAVVGIQTAPGKFTTITSPQQYKQLEHTGTHKYPQTTTWVKVS